jgi:NADH:ubiquinone oxidoreductase subunit 6 (subunit J)
MDLKAGLFYVFSAVLLFAAFRVVTARNPVHAALYLVLSFFQAAMIWMLLKAEFLAIALVLVYLGAVMVLFLFVVMMLDINTDRLREGFWRNAPVALTVGIIVVLELGAVSPSASTRNAWTPPEGGASRPGSRKPTPMTTMSPAIDGPEADSDRSGCSQRTFPSARS